MEQHEMAPGYTTQQFRREAIAYLRDTNPDCATWSTGYLLAALRHTPAGAKLWNDARNANFWGR